MKIISLEAENIKRLRAIEIRPDGNIVEIAGRNGQGKTSILDSLWWALKGTKNIQARPIRAGCERGLIKLDLGELVVTRKFTAKDDGDFTTEIRVEAADGRVLKSPQAVLDALAGDLSFDPLAFKAMKPREQFDALRSLVPDLDFAAVERDNKADYDERTLVNRRQAQAEAEARAIHLPEGGIPSADDLPGLEQQLSTAGAHNAEIEGRKARREAAEQAIKDLSAQIAQLCDRRDDLQQKLDEAGPLPEAIDVAEIQRKLALARSNSQVAQDAAKKKRLEAEARECTEKSEALTKAIDQRKASVARLISEANIPVPGLSFSDGEVFLNGQPFAQASDAEQLRASVAIAGALNPELRIVRVRDGSLLDSAGMDALREYAEAHDLQVWIELVREDARSGFIIEDGAIKAAEDPEFLPL